MATTSLGGLEVLRLPELLVLIKRTAEWARNRRVLNPREAMVPNEVKEAKVLYARARAWPLGDPLRRAERSVFRIPSLLFWSGTPHRFSSPSDHHA